MTYRKGFRMDDFILSKHGKGKNAKYYKMVNKPYGITEISRSTYYRLSKILENWRFSNE